MAARQAFGLKLEVLAFTSSEEPEDPEFLFVLAKESPTTAVLAPTHAPRAYLRLRRRLAKSPLGPMLRGARRTLQKHRNASGI